MTLSKFASINARQIKAARALLDWSQEDLASASGLSIATIRKIEAGNTSPRGKTNVQLLNAFERLGLEFWEPGGVRFRPEEIIVLEGIEGAKAFYEDVYQTLNKLGGEALTIGPDSTRLLLSDEFIDYSTMHFNRMESIKYKACIKCIQTGSRTKIAAPRYCEYRFLPEKQIGSIYYYIFGDKICFRTYKEKHFPKMILITSKTLSDQFREHFYAIWENAIPINVRNE